MSCRRFLKDEEGAVAVLVALCMTVLLGFTAFAVDYGGMAAAKQSMQNAADAAALAGAADLAGDHSTAAIVSRAEEYTAVNGYDSADADVTVDTQVTASTVTVTVSKELKMGFSAVLTGRAVRTVSAGATAGVDSIFGSYPYALFAGQEIADEGTGITITGNSIDIYSDIHSNSRITMKNADLRDGAVATAVGATSPSGGNWNSGSVTIDMPKYSSLEGKFSNLVTINSSALSGISSFQGLLDKGLELYAAAYGPGNTDYTAEGLSIYVDGSLTLGGRNSTVYTASYPINLVVNGGIDFNGCPLNSTAQAPVTLISKTGDIVVNGGGVSFFGTIFAPEGDVTINGSSYSTFTGSMIAQNIRKNGGKIAVEYDGRADDFIPRTKVRLIA